MSFDWLNVPGLNVKDGPESSAGSAPPPTVSFNFSEEQREDESAGRRTQDTQEEYRETAEDLRVPLSLSGSQLAPEELKTYRLWYKCMVSRRRSRTLRLEEDIFRFLGNFQLSDSVKERTRSIFRTCQMAVSPGQFYAIMRTIAHALQANVLPTRRMILERAAVPEPRSILSLDAGQETYEEVEEDPKSAADNRVDFDSFASLLLTGKTVRKNIRRKINKRNGRVKKVSFSENLVTFHEELPEEEAAEDAADGSEDPNEPLDFSMPMDQLLKKMAERKTRNTALVSEAPKQPETVEEREELADMRDSLNHFKHIQTADNVAQGSFATQYMASVSSNADSGEEPALEPLKPTATGSANHLFRSHMQATISSFTKAPAAPVTTPLLHQSEPSAPDTQGPRSELQGPSGARTQLSTPALQAQGTGYYAQNGAPQQASTPALQAQGTGYYQQNGTQQQVITPALQAQGTGYYQQNGASQQASTPALQTQGTGYYQQNGTQQQVITPALQAQGTGYYQQNGAPQQASTPALQAQGTGYYPQNGTQQPAATSIHQAHNAGFPQQDSSSSAHQAQAPGLYRNTASPLSAPTLQVQGSAYYQNSNPPLPPQATGYYQGGNPPLLQVQGTGYYQQSQDSGSVPANRSSTPVLQPQSTGYYRSSSPMHSPMHLPAMVSQQSPQPSHSLLAVPDPQRPYYGGGFQPSSSPSSTNQHTAPSQYAPTSGYVIPNTQPGYAALSSHPSQHEPAYLAANRYGSPNPPFSSSPLLHQQHLPHNNFLQPPQHASQPLPPKTNIIGDLRALQQQVDRIHHSYTRR
ncbi:ADR356Cp [Eremothecium gossypii ATCC 10895]|uniref:ADR356Cp n=1 Tax=Eremothecium gossypii (strain ATCC 10895 / CBS 109.51 / FGSC 9923 / NRRL Y-1056) TaxID=284811 RepID=Q759C1_EREGS|nr:ADR356Cp [Eremothecium gossypii ATCC 10895]AAS52276.2 ADR356Cp [Eremothecium gossypii ATCC 10895]AEY96574.1 FADR356Cp [Eremothecium gossypii FDAG1]